MSRVLILRLSSLGDIVQALPLAGSLEAGGHRVSWLLEDRFAGLESLLGSWVSPLIWRRGWKGSWALRGKGRQGFDLGLDLQGNWKSAFLAKVLGLKRVVGFARPELREPWAGLLWEERMAPSATRGMAERAWELACFALEEALPPLPPPPYLFPSSAARVRLRKTLEKLGFAGEAPLDVLVAGAASDPRAWPLRRIIALYRRLPGPALVLLGPRERSLVLPPWVSCLRQEGEGGLEELVALGAHLRETGGRALGHDGGAMHVLDAAGAETLFLFGPQDPERTGPRGGRVLQGETPLPCRPCRKPSCSLPQGPLCMESIRVEDVLDVLRAHESPSDLL